MPNHFGKDNIEDSVKPDSPLFNASSPVKDPSNVLESNLNQANVHSASCLNLNFGIKRPSEAISDSQVPYEPLSLVPPPKRPSFELLPYRGKSSRSLEGGPSLDSESVVETHPEMKLLSAPTTLPYEASVSNGVGPEQSLRVGQTSGQGSKDDWVVYHDWKVILRNRNPNQVVLYNQRNHQLAINSGFGLIKSPDHKVPTTCRLCNQPLPPFANKSGAELNSVVCSAPSPTFTNHEDFRKRQGTDWPDNFMDSDYFRWLAISHSRAHGRLLGDDPVPPFNDPHVDPSNILNEAAFNQGYYQRFFVEERKLGRGARGNVYLCQHVLDEIQLGKYAVKKVAIGNDHSWLVRMLKEVHMLERLHHRNIIDYKHAWLENYQPTIFAPIVPCLFILMECANGGNLEEFVRRRSGELEEQQLTAKQRAKRLRRQRERLPKGPAAYLSLREILSLFLDICHGLSHLHCYSIVHRDLKPPNLLLSYKDLGASDEIPRVLISDFGECEDVAKLSCIAGRTGATGTLEFMAPELLVVDGEGHYTGEHSLKADLWSLGMVLYYLCYSELPYRHLDDLALLREEILAFRGPIRFPDDGLSSPRIPTQFKTLISLLLSHDPQRRPSVDEILSNARSVDLQQLAPEHFRDTPESLKDWPHHDSPPDIRPSLSEVSDCGVPLLQDQADPISVRFPCLILILLGLKMGSLLFPCHPQSARLLASVPLTVLAVGGLQSQRLGPQLCLALVHASLLAFLYFATGSICGA